MNRSLIAYIMSIVFVGLSIFQMVSATTPVHAQVSRDATGFVEMNDLHGGCGETHTITDISGLHETEFHLPAGARQPIWDVSAAVRHNLNVQFRLKQVPCYSDGYLDPEARHRTTQVLDSAVRMICLGEDFCPLGFRPIFLPIALDGAMPSPPEPAVKLRAAAANYIGRIIEVDNKCATHAVVNASGVERPFKASEQSWPVLTLFVESGSPARVFLHTVSCPHLGEVDGFYAVTCLLEEECPLILTRRP